MLKGRKTLITCMFVVLFLMTGLAPSLAANQEPTRYPLPGDPVGLSKYEFMVDNDTVVRLAQAGLAYDPITEELYYRVVVSTHSLNGSGLPTFIPDGLVFDRGRRESPIRLREWEGLVEIDRGATASMADGAVATIGYYMSLSQSNIVRPRILTVVLKPLKDGVNPVIIRFNLKDLSILDAAKN